MDNKLVKINIILWAVVLVVALGAFSVLTFSGSAWKANPFSMTSFGSSNRASFVTVKEETFSKDIDNLSLSWISDEIQVRIGDSESIRVVQTASPDLPERFLFRSKASNDHLTIGDERKQSFIFNLFSSGTHITDLTVYLPEKQYRMLEIDTVSAHTLLDPLSAQSLVIRNVSGNLDFSGSYGKISLDTVSGQMTGYKLKADELESNTVSGNINCNGSFGSFEGDTTSGDLTIVSSICPKEVDISTISGDCSLSIPENDGFALEFSKVSGSFESNFSYQMQSKNTFTYKNGSADFSMDTISGNCFLYKI